MRKKTISLVIFIFSAVCCCFGQEKCIAITKSILSAMCYHGTAEQQPAWLMLSSSVDLYKKVATVIVASQNAQTVHKILEIILLDTFLYFEYSC